MSSVESLEVRNKALRRIVKQVAGAGRDKLLHDFVFSCETASVVAGEAYGVAERILQGIEGGKSIEDMAGELNRCIEHLTAAAGAIEDAMSMAERLRGMR